MRFVKTKPVDVVLSKGLLLKLVPMDVETGIPLTLHPMDPLHEE
jgi:hypothetical protein